MLIVFEGIDRSGKSTQSRKLYEQLQAHNIPTLLLRYPERSSALTGQLIDDYLAGRSEMTLGAASLLLAANLWEIHERILRAHEAGSIVLMDRYVWSNIAYSTARGMDRPAFEAISRGLPQPDLIIFCKISPKDAAQRGGFGKERFERLEFQERVGECFNELAQSCPPHSCLVIDAARDMCSVAEEIQTAVLERIQRANPSCVSL